MELVIVGSVGLDTVQTPSGKVTDVLGGSAMYASFASNRFCRTGLVGVVGSDFPSCYLERLKEFGIHYEGLETVEGKTFRWAGIYNDLNKAETLDTQLNVFADFNPKMPALYREAPYLLLGNIHPSLQLQVLKQMKNTKVVAADTMNFWIERAKEELLQLISKVQILFINEEEIKQLTGEQNIYCAAEEALKLGPQLLIIKRGEYGALAYGKDILFFTPVYPVRSVFDPTGAGDSFAGGFMGYLADKDELTPSVIKGAMLNGTVMASINIESFSLERLWDTNNDEILQRNQAIRQFVSI